MIIFDPPSPKPSSDLWMTSLKQTPYLASFQQAFGRLESLVAGLVKKTDELETLVEAQAEELHSTSVAALAKRVEKLEITKVTQVLESCEQVAQTGITEPGFFPLDFDGKGFGLPTINVYCDLPSVTTVIGKEVSFDIEKCNTAGCFEKLITYDKAPMPQIVALLNSASECSQSLTLNCFIAPISVSIAIPLHQQATLHFSSSDK